MWSNLSVLAKNSPDSEKLAQPNFPPTNVTACQCCFLQGKINVRWNLWVFVKPCQRLAVWGRWRWPSSRSVQAPTPAVALISSNWQRSSLRMWEVTPEQDPRLWLAWVLPVYAALSMDKSGNYSIMGVIELVSNPFKMTLMAQHSHQFVVWYPRKIPNEQRSTLAM